VVGETLASEVETERRLRVYLGGGIALRGMDGTVVGERAFAGRQARRLFARLVVARGPVAQEDLADDLWGPSWPPAWQVALRALVSKLRAILSTVGSGAIVSRDGAYELRLPARSWVDADAAIDAIHRAETSLRAGALADACGWALAARAIAVRPILPGEDGDWLDDLRRRLVDVRLRSFECLAEIWLETGDPAAAVRDAREAIAIDPYRESAHRQLMRAHIAAGERGAAIRAFEALRDQLRDDLGVPPSPETVALATGVSGGASGT